MSTRATLLQRYLLAYNKDVASIKVATLRSLQSRITNIILCVKLCVIGEQQYQQLQIPLISFRLPFKVSHSVLVNFILVNFSPLQCRDDS